MPGWRLCRALVDGAGITGTVDELCVGAPAGADTACSGGGPVTGRAVHPPSDPTTTATLTHRRQRQQPRCLPAHTMADIGYCCASQLCMAGPSRRQPSLLTMPIIAGVQTRRHTPLFVTRQRVSAAPPHVEVDA